MASRNKSAGSKARQKKNVYVTKSGNSIKINRGLNNKWKAKKDLKARNKAVYLSGLPSGKFRRLLFHLQPKRIYHYWFSKKGLIMSLKIFGICVVLGFIFLIGMFAYFRKDLPNLRDITGTNLGGSISYYDRTGTILLFQDYNAIKRIPVKSNQMSPYIKNATVAIEDKSFYHEGAFDVKGILRAGINDTLHSGNGVQGGSTITQQLVKLNENWTNDHTLTRKVKEIILAVEIQREYTKDEILTGYLNIAPYGGIEYGAQAASQDYFHTSAANLTLAQASLLAAIPKSPDIYSPYSPDFDKVAFKARQSYILDQMASQGFITKAQANDAKKVDVLAQIQPLQNKYTNIKAPYFVLAAKNQLEQQYGAATVNRGGWKVITTLNMQDQQLAEQDIANNIPNITRYGADEEAMVGESVPTGQILMEVGGTDFFNADHGAINYAQTLIAPGSSFKPYDYVSMINDTTNTGAGSALYDVQQPLPGYPCTNKELPLNGGNCLEDYDFKYPGAEELRYALAGSRNVPAVKAMLTVGTNKVISTADALMGYPNAYQCYSDEARTIPTQCYGSSAIGDGAFLHLDQHVNGDASLARLGAEIPNTYILKIVDSNNKQVYQWTQPKATQVVRPDAAYIVDNMLSDPKASYLPGSCTASTCTSLSRGGYKFQRYNGWDFAVKTGTTNNSYDGLMTSWSTQLAVVSWVGYHTDNQALRSGGMEYMTEPLTRTWIQSATDALNMSPVNWTQPSDVKVLPSFVQTTHVGIGSEEPGPSTDLFPSWYVGNGKASTTNQTLDKVSGLLATSCTPSQAKENSTASNVSAFSADIFWPVGQGASTNATSTTATDNVHNCSDSPPSVTITGVSENSGGTGKNNTCVVGQVCDVQITAQAGTHPLSDPGRAQFPGTINLLVNGTSVDSYTIDSTNDCNNTSPQDCNIVLQWTPSATYGGQQVTLSVNVTDSVLYQASFTYQQTVNITSAPANTPPNNTQVFLRPTGRNNGNGGGIGSDI
jgi:penicillin-binding protein 1A